MLKLLLLLLFLLWWCSLLCAVLLLEEDVCVVEGLIATERGMSSYTDFDNDW